LSKTIWQVSIEPFHKKNVPLKRIVIADITRMNFLC